MRGVESLAEVPVDELGEQLAVLLLGWVVEAGWLILAAGRELFLGDTLGGAIDIGLPDCILVAGESVSVAICWLGELTLTGALPRSSNPRLLVYETVAPSAIISAIMIRIIRVGVASHVFTGRWAAILYAWVQFSERFITAETSL